MEEWDKNGRMTKKWKNVWYDETGMEEFRGNGKMYDKMIWKWEKSWSDDTETVEVVNGLYKTIEEKNTTG